MLKSIAFALSAMFLVAVATPNTVQAAPILTQEFLDADGESFGILSIDLDKADEFGTVFEWHKFELFGIEMGENFGFEVQFDIENLMAGFTFFYFDVTDVYGLFAIQGFWDAAYQDSFIDVFDLETFDPVAWGSFTLSQAHLVSEPAALFLMLGAVGGLLLRRRKA